MDRHTLAVLDFQRVLELLSEGAESPQGADVCFGLGPAPTLEAAQIRQEELQALADVEPVLGLPSATGLHRIEEAVDTARTEGTCLDPETLILVRDTVGTCHRILEYLEDAASEGSILGAYAADVKPLYELSDRFDRTFGPRGEILDTASPALQAIREEIRRVRERVLRTLQAVLHDRHAEPVVQDDFVTIRGDRYVIPLKTDFRGSLSGIIHDRSRSGATFFVEPLEAVELNNQQSILREEEDREVRRILLDLTRWVGTEAGKIRANLAVAAHLDGLAARLRLARRLRCSRPQLCGEPVLEIRGARHPLLLLQRAAAEVVPVDIRLGETTRLLLITGANAGGKTVALKTAGLLVLMARAGLFIPAGEGSRIGWFRGLFADIGDEQDIDRNLSTFSAHVSLLRDILDLAGEGSLVLLDELGTGTDPREGAGLAMAVLDSLLDEGVSIVATTHLAGLKAYVYTRPEAQNAAVAFDPATGRPLFRLLYGQAGSSNAFEVAERLGLPAPVLARAKAYAGAGTDAVGRLLEGIESAQTRAREASEEADALRGEWRVVLAEAEAARAAAVRQRDAARQEQRKEAQALIAEMRGELRRAIAAFVRRQVSQQEAEGVLASAERRLMETLTPEQSAPQGVDGLAPACIALGTRVVVSSLSREGIVEALDLESGRATVRAGPLRITVSADELQELGSPAPKPATHTAAVFVEAEGGSQEVMLVGLKVEEALRRLDRALDGALVAGRTELRVVHGRGTGALRRAVRERLEADPHVKTVRPDSRDDAVTWVDLA